MSPLDSGSAGARGAGGRPFSARSGDQGLFLFPAPPAQGPAAGGGPGRAAALAPGGREAAAEPGASLRRMLALRGCGGGRRGRRCPRLPGTSRPARPTPRGGGSAGLPRRAWRPHLRPLSAGTCPWRSPPANSRSLGRPCPSTLSPNPLLAPFPPRSPQASHFPCLALGGTHQVCVKPLISLFIFDNKDSPPESRPPVRSAKCLFSLGISPQSHILDP